MTDDASGREETTRSTLGVWGSLQLIEEVGQGGFGVVYRAWEPVLAREVALKVIRPREGRTDAVDEVLREGQLLARVRHPNVVTIFGAQRIGDEVGLWMEFVRGRSLSSLLRRDGPQAPAEAAVIGVSLCQALAAVHKAGVIHRDIKAQNVMRESGGRIVLMDFGAGQVLEPGSGRSEDVVGTPAYMAPEVLLGQRATVVSDLYSLGVLLYHLVAGSFPVEGEGWTDFVVAHSRRERRLLSDARPDVPPDFSRVIDRATALDPDERFQSPGALLRALSETTAASRSIGRDPEKTDVVPQPSPVPVGLTVDRRLVVAAGLALGIWVLGILTSVTFNFTVARIGKFPNESVFSWWIWGFRALIPAGVEVSIVLLVWGALSSAGRVLARAAPPVRWMVQSTGTLVRSASRRTGLDDTAALAQLLLALQVLAMAAFCWYFADVFSAMTSFLDTATMADLEAFRPDHLFRNQMYILGMAMLILAMSVATHALRKRQRRRGITAGAASLGANYAAIAVGFIVLVLPYRLVWQNDREVAGYQGAQCYILADVPTFSYPPVSVIGKAPDTGPSVLLYCPTSDVPRTKWVPRSEPTLVPEGRTQSFYTRPTNPQR